MRHDKFSTELELLLQLTGHTLTANELGEVTGLSRRNIYYYLETFMLNPNFELEKIGDGYTLSRRSKFFSKLFNNLAFDEKQTKELHRVLNQILEQHDQNSKIKLLRYAIDNRRIVVLQGYSSSNSGTFSDRLVEPFLLLNNNTEVRCHEITTGKNKTFRLSRMEDIRMTSQNWEHAEKHKDFHTDIFGYSSEDFERVVLSLDRTSYNAIVEAYPQSRFYISKHEDGVSNTWTLDAKVCSMKGVGRFVLSYIDHIEIIKNDNLVSYLKETISKNPKMTL